MEEYASTEKVELYIIQWKELEEISYNELYVGKCRQGLNPIFLTNNLALRWIFKVSENQILSFKSSKIVWKKKKNILIVISTVPSIEYSNDPFSPYKIDYV